MRNSIGYGIILIAAALVIVFSIIPDKPAVSSKQFAEYCAEAVAKTTVYPPSTVMQEPIMQLRKLDDENYFVDVGYAYTQNGFGAMTTIAYICKGTNQFVRSEVAEGYMVEPLFDSIRPDTRNGTYVSRFR